MQNKLDRAGRFIVFEGIDGAGKTTQIEFLKKRLVERGFHVTCSAEPTPTALGGLIRDALSETFPRTPDELAAMFLADRVAHNSGPNGISALLKAGDIVISDRYYYSSFAYQGLYTDINWIMDMNLNCPAIEKPDLCIFLDLDPDTSKKRIDTNRRFAEIFERSAETLHSIRNRFFDVFKKLEGRNFEPSHFKVIDAARAPNEIADDIFEAVEKIL